MHTKAHVVGDLLGVIYTFDPSGDVALTGADLSRVDGV